MQLADLVVVDLATLGAAPQIAAFFGDLGARVIKVEHPRGDSLRELVDARGVPLQWQILNRNKHCITLDAATAAGAAVLERLLARADVLVTNLSAARLRRWRLAPAELAERFPALVAINLTTYGIEGPWAERPGSGTLAEAAAGLAGLTGEADGPPGLAPVGLGDHLGALQGIIAALVGLLARAAGAPARFADLSMTRPVLALLAHRIATAARDGVEPGRHGNRFPNVAPRNTYRAADGAWVALTAGTDQLAARALAAAGHAELAEDPRFRDNLARVAHADELDALLGEWIRARPGAQAAAILCRAGVPAAVCDGLLEVVDNPHFRARGELVEVGPLTLATPVPPGDIRWLGRDLGADNELVYRDWLGLGEEELARLRRDGVV